VGTSFFPRIPGFFDQAKFAKTHFSAEQRRTAQEHAPSVAQLRHSPFTSRSHFEVGCGGTLPALFAPRLCYPLSSAPVVAGAGFVQDPTKTELKKAI
jgi:hypothetical protein